MNRIFNYWCAHSDGAYRQLLIIGDIALYDQRHDIEKRLPDGFAATTVSIPEDISYESFLTTLMLFLKQGGISYDAVYFRPKCSFDKEQYKKLLDNLIALLPDTMLILGSCGSEADKTVCAVSEELDAAYGDVDTMLSLLTTVPKRKEEKAMLEDGEAIGWIKYETRSFEKMRPRVLLIGDSIIWGGHEFTANALVDRADVNTFVTSFGVNGTRLSDIVENLCSMDSAGYDAVYFNNGLHSHGQTPEEYAENYRKTVTYLMKCFPNAKWILGFSTPVSDNPKSGDRHETPITEKQRADNSEKNTLAKQYNEKVRVIAKELSLPYFDAYSLMADKDEWKIDSYHYNEQGKRLFGEAVASKILSEMALKAEDNRR